MGPMANATYTPTDRLTGGTERDRGGRSLMSTVALWCLTGALYRIHGQNAARATAVFTQRLPRRTCQHRQYIVSSNFYFAQHRTYRAISQYQQSALKLKFHGSSFPVASSHARRNARHLREDATRMSRLSGYFPVHLATRLPDWSAGGLVCGVVLPVCPCVVSFSKFHEPDTHDLLRTSRYSIIGRHV